MTHLKRVLVTGANGFVGRSLCRRLLEKQFLLRTVLRSEQKAQEFAQALSPFFPHVECFVINDINAETDWSTILHNLDVVVHLAARVHVMEDNAEDPLREFRKVNVAGTEQLAKSAAAMGVQRFIYLSSIKVNGESTKQYSNGSWQCYSESDIPNPQGPYAQSKWEAEQMLHRIAKETGLDVVIIRPPLVYGRDVRANFLSLLNIVKKGLPIPLASVNNRRSFIYVENLVDAIVVCITQAAAAGQTYLVSDGQDVSTPELIRQIAKVLGKPARLWPFPPSLMRLAGKIIGKSASVERLLSSHTIDSSKIIKELGWKPSYTLQEALQRDFGNIF